MLVACGKNKAIASAVAKHYAFGRVLVSNNLPSSKKKTTFACRKVYFYMTDKTVNADFVFEVSWEVCNKVGGIHTVLKSLSPTLHSIFGDNLVFLGPDLNTCEFTEDKSLNPLWQDALRTAGLKFRIGRWNIHSTPMVILVDIHQFLNKKNSIYEAMWNDFRVDSLCSYGDYDESSMWAYACGKVVETITQSCIERKKHVVLQAHEWQSAMALLCVKKNQPHSIATVFTTHATTVGRSICDNGKCLYKYFDKYNGDGMAHELNVVAKHTSEKAAAIFADCFTTVSETTNRECASLLGKQADVILPNGFNVSDLPPAKLLTARRRMMRKKILAIVGALCGMCFDDEDTVIISTSGRNDYKPKGFDVYMEALRRLQKETIQKEVIALIEVPCWVMGPRADLLNRLETRANYSSALPNPFITHDLHNFDYDRIVNTIKSLDLDKSTLSGHVHVLLIPSYLDGKDGIVNEQYYDLLTACDITAYPSYYEPWGYTPMESASFRVPTVTTNLAGFGCWVENLLCREPDIKDGVVLVERNDDNYFEASEGLKNIFLEYLHMTKSDIRIIRNNVYNIVRQADWKTFVNNYLRAFSFALNKQKDNHQ